MSKGSIKDDASFLQFVPGWFVTQQKINIWHDNDDYCNDDCDYWHDVKLNKSN